MGNLRSSLLLTFMVLESFTLATSNSTEFAPPFVPEPRGRGTFGILWSCLATLGLCVWTSIHADVIPNSTGVERLIQKLVWMMFALLMPEVVVAVALKQWHEARRVHQQWCEHFKIEPWSKGDCMGMEGAFFVVMGGFVIGTGKKGGEGEKQEEEEEDTVTRKTLTSEGFIECLRLDLIPRGLVNRKIIMDKGKADTLAKLLVCFQALWMVVQCAARKASGLQVTLFELHVLIQVAFVAAMYGLWWYKPLNVNEAIVAVHRGALSEGWKSTKNHPRVGIARGFKLIYKLWVSAYAEDEDQYLRIILTVLCILTGISHAIAWNYHFPTPLEGLLWRVSSVTLGGVPLVQYLLTVVHLRTSIDFIGSISAITLYILYIVYGFAIIFITVESFLSMRRLPIRSYESVAWMDFWPHI